MSDFWYTGQCCDHDKRKEVIDSHVLLWLRMGIVVCRYEVIRCGMQGFLPESRPEELFPISGQLASLRHPVLPEQPRPLKLAQSFLKLKEQSIRLQ